MTDGAIRARITTAPELPGPERSTMEATMHTTADTAHEILSALVDGPGWSARHASAPGIIGPLAADETDLIVGRPITSAMLFRAAMIAARHGHTVTTDDYDGCALVVWTRGYHDGPADDTAACPACGDPIDYCRGHGPSGDPTGAAILAAHDDDDHTRCNPIACDDAAATYCRRHDMYRPCHWCGEPETMWDTAETARLRGSYDPSPDAFAVIADRGAVSLVAAVLVALVTAVLVVVLASCSVSYTTTTAPARTTSTTAPAPAPARSAPVAEDSAGWSCWHDGNGWCGPITVVLAADGSASVLDNAPSGAASDALVVSGLPVSYDPDTARPLPCAVYDRTASGPARSGRIASVTVHTDGPTAVTDGSSLASVVHDGPAGPCAGAVASVVLY